MEDVERRGPLLLHRTISMTILFLHGWQSVPGGVKRTYLAQHGHTVLNPKLPDEDFDLAVQIAQEEFDKHRPDVVIGSSRGGAVAMNINSGSAIRNARKEINERNAALAPASRQANCVPLSFPGTVQNRQCQQRCKMIQAISLRFVAVLCVAVLALSLTGCGDSKIDSKITKSNYDLIEIGMKEAAVEAILGKGAIPTNTAWAKGDSPPGAATIKERRGGTKQITISFSNGVVWRKNQSGL